MEADLYKTIRWPSPPNAASTPIWTGAGFEIDGQRAPVLAGDIGDSGWSDELAELLNMEVAPDRPLGIASRRHAIDALRRSNAAGPGRTVMEIGCAHGFMLEDIASAFPGTAIIGSDYALPPLEALSKRLPAIPLVQLDLTNASLPDSFCDAIVILNVLEHIEDDETALNHIKRMLKPGGLLVIEVPSSPSLYDEFDRLVGHFRRYTMGDLAAKIERAGFTIEKKSHLGFFVFPAFWSLVQLKKLRAQGGSEKNTEVLKSRIKVGRRSTAQQIVFSLETSLRPYLPMPFGVRCLVRAVA